MEPAILTTNKSKNMDLEQRLQEFIDNEARSCSMDYGCITPLYVYRMWRGTVSLEAIQAAWPKDCRVI